MSLLYQVEKLLFKKFLLHFLSCRHTAPDPKNRFTPYKPEDHPHGLLPPPPYFDDWVRHRQVEFKLPYDLWWLHTHNQLPGRDVVESWKYKRIKMSTFCLFIFILQFLLR